MTQGDSCDKQDRQCSDQSKTIHPGSLLKCWNNSNCWHCVEWALEVQWKYVDFRILVWRTQKTVMSGLGKFWFFVRCKSQCQKTIGIWSSLNFQNCSLVFWLVFESGNSCAEVEATWRVNSTGVASNKLYQGFTSEFHLWSLPERTQKTPFVYRPALRRFYRIINMCISKTMCIIA